MKHVSNTLLSIFFLLFLGNAMIANAEEPADTVLLYFEAIRNGDVESVKSFLGGNLYKKRKVLLEQNEKYPDFLRERFGEAEFTVEGAPQDITETTKSIRVKISFKDGSSLSTNLVTERMGPGLWKIVDQLRN